MTFPQETLLWIPEEPGLLPALPSPELEFPPRWETTYTPLPLVAPCGTPRGPPLGTLRSGHPSAVRQGAAEAAEVGSPLPCPGLAGGGQWAMGSAGQGAGSLVGHPHLLADALFLLSLLPSSPSSHPLLLPFLPLPPPLTAPLLPLLPSPPPEVLGGGGRCLGAGECRCCARPGPSLG